MKTFRSALAIFALVSLGLPLGAPLTWAAPLSVSAESELILKLTRLMQTPAAEAVFRSTPEGQAFARRVFGTAIHSSDELPYLARTWVESRPPRQSLEDLYASLQELRSVPAAEMTSGYLEIFARRQLSLAATHEIRFLRFTAIDARSLNPTLALAREAFVSDGLLASEVGANRVAHLLKASPFARTALLDTAEGARIVRAIFARAHIALPAHRGLVPDALVTLLRREELGWAAIDLGDRLHDLVGLQSHIHSTQEVARMLALDPRYPRELLVFKELRAVLE